MTDRELLVELLAIKLHEHQCFGSNMLPEGRQAWGELSAEDRANIRELIIHAEIPEALFPDEADVTGDIDVRKA